MENDFGVSFSKVKFMSPTKLITYLEKPTIEDVEGLIALSTKVVSLIGFFSLLIMIIYHIL